MKYKALGRGSGPCECCIRPTSQMATRREDGLTFCDEPAAVEINFDGETQKMCAFHYEEYHEKGEPTLEEIRNG